MQQFFNWEEVQLHHFYIYYFLALIVAAFLVFRSNAKYKIELFFISFYLLTGNINELLTIEIPGLSFFKIQPIRFIFLLLLFLIVRKLWFSNEKTGWGTREKIPLFEIALYAYVSLLIISVLVNSADIGIKEVQSKTIDALTFLILILGLRLMADKQSYLLIGKSMIIGAVASSVVSLIQLFVNPYFLRIGDDRIAFNGVLRSNGIFEAEYFNSYYLIIALVWTLITIKKKSLKVPLICLFLLGVLSSFQRMSWIILLLVLITYAVYIKKISFGKLVWTGLSSIVILLSLSIFFYQDIMNSSLVKERLTDSIDGRKGYYKLVIDNIGDKPIFGYGDFKNEVYYVNMLRVTNSRSRASAESGDLHSGYFTAMFLYGIPAFVCFILFVMLSAFYFARLYQNNLYFIIPLLVSFIYIVGNLTNTFLFLKYISVLYALHLGIGLGIKQIEERKLNEN